MLAVRQLRSSDLIIHIDSPSGKKEFKENTDWVGTVAPSVMIRKRTWPVIIHTVNMAYNRLDVWETMAKRIEKDNAKLTPGLRIRGLRWLRRINKIEYAPLVIEIDSVE